MLEKSEPHTTAAQAEEQGEEKLSSHGRGGDTIAIAGEAAGRSCQAGALTRTTINNIKNTDQTTACQHHVDSLKYLH